MGKVVLIGTLDTKGPETAYLRDRIRETGLETLVLDSGILGEPVGIEPDVTREDVARASGSDLESIRNAGSRGAAVEIMMKGVAATCARLHREGNCHGVISLGGAEGAVLASAGMQALPVGVPKVIVTPLAAGRRTFGPFVGIRDVMVMHSVVDILGLNSVSRIIFDQAAGAVSGMVKAMEKSNHEAADASRTIAITMLGNTTKAVERIKKSLETEGFEVIVYHSSGVGGAAMEEMIREGRVGAVIDFTTDELTDHLVGGFHDAGPKRLEAAGDKGIPQIVVPGCIDFFVQGPRNTVPEKWAKRAAYYHNPSFTLIRTSREEMTEIGKVMATKLNAAKGTVKIVIPLGGLSIANCPGGEFHDPEGDRLFRESLKKHLRDDIPVEEVDAHINDEEFSTRVTKCFFEQVRPVT